MSRCIKKSAARASRELQITTSRRLPAHTLTASLIVLAAGLSGCGSDSNPTDPTDPTGPTSSEAQPDSAASPAADGLPQHVRPNGEKVDTTAACPYFSNDAIADTNGERVTATAIDDRFNPVSCQWWSYEDMPQAQIIVRTANSEQDAINIIDDAIRHPGTVDEAAELSKNADNTVSGGNVDKATDPEGWTGYRASATNSAAYAVRKGTTVVIVHSDQEQTIKAQKIAEQTIANLNL